jgi:heme exporter protein C
MTSTPAAVLGWLALVALAAGLFAGFGWAPPEAAQGNVQRIMYLHLPSILAGYLAFIVAGAASAAYLVTRRPSWDRCAASAAEVGVLFGALMIVSGAIWGRPTWGVWWTWDARLTSTAVLLLTWVAYLLLRAMVEDPDMRARFAAVVGILGVAQIPIVHLSVRWWRTLHQPSTILGPGPPTIDSAFKLPLAVNAVAFTLLFAYFLARRMEIARLEDEA